MSRSSSLPQTPTKPTHQAIFRGVSVNISTCLAADPDIQILRCRAGKDREQAEVAGHLTLGTSTARPPPHASAGPSIPRQGQRPRSRKTSRRCCAPCWLTASSSSPIWTPGRPPSTPFSPPGLSSRRPIPPTQPSCQEGPGPDGKDPPHPQSAAQPPGLLPAHHHGAVRRRASQPSPSGFVPRPSSIPQDSPAPTTSPSALARHLLGTSLARSPFSPDDAIGSKPRSRPLAAPHPRLMLCRSSLASNSKRKAGAGTCPGHRPHRREAHRKLTHSPGLTPSFRSRRLDTCRDGCVCLRLHPNSPA